MSSSQSQLRSALSRLSQGWLTAYAVVVSFSLYFTTYCIRMPVFAARFEGSCSTNNKHDYSSVLLTLVSWFRYATCLGVKIWSLEIKSALVIAQTVGYALSKIPAVMYGTQVTPSARPKVIVALFLLGVLSLVLLGIAEDVPNGEYLMVFAMFLNGLPLSWVWGQIMYYLEGRRTSEILGAGLSFSFIVSSGAAKSLGTHVHQELGVSENWMPFVTAVIVLPGGFLALWFTHALPPPSSEDRKKRSKRDVMDAQSKRLFFSAFAPGLLLLTVSYMIITAYRSFRDFFATELWHELLPNDKGAISAVLTYTEIPVGIAVLLVLALLYRIEDNRMGLFVMIGFQIFGVCLIGFSTMLFDLAGIGGVAWMIMNGIGLFLAYVPFGSMLFDRLIAAAGISATAVFMIYTADGVGYVGTISLLLFKSFGSGDLSFVQFLRVYSYMSAIFGVLCLTMTVFYFRFRLSAGKLIHDPKATDDEQEDGQA